MYLDLSNGLSMNLFHTSSMRSQFLFSFRGEERVFESVFGNGSTRRDTKSADSRLGYEHHGRPTQASRCARTDNSRQRIPGERLIFRTFIS